MLISRHTYAWICSCACFFISICEHTYTQVCTWVCVHVYIWQCYVAMCRQIHAWVFSCGPVSTCTCVFCYIWGKYQPPHVFSLSPIWLSGWESPSLSIQLPRFLVAVGNWGLEILRRLGSSESLLPHSPPLLVSTPFLPLKRTPRNWEDDMASGQER